MIDAVPALFVMVAPTVELVLSKKVTTIPGVSSDTVVDNVKDSPIYKEVTFSETCDMVAGAGVGEGDGVGVGFTVTSGLSGAVIV